MRIYIKPFTGLGEKLQPESAERTESEVVGRAATDAEYDGLRSVFFGGEPNELTRTVGGGLPRIARLRREQRQAARLREFDDGDERVVGQRGQCEQRAGGGRYLVGGHEAEVRGGRLVAWASDDGMLECAAGSEGEDFSKALAAVSERTVIEQPVRVAFTERARGRLTRLRSREGIFKFVEGEENAHGGGRLSFWPSLRADIGEAWHGAAVHDDGFGEHRGGTYPEAACAVKRLIDDERIQGLGVASETEHAVVIALVMAVASGARLDREGRKVVHRVRVDGAGDFGQ